MQVTRRSGRTQGFLSFDVRLHAMPDELTGEESLTVTPPRKAQGVSVQERFMVDSEQSDDMASPSSGSEDGHYSRMSTRRRSYALRPKSFSFNGLLSCY